MLESYAVQVVGPTSVMDYPRRTGWLAFGRRKPFIKFNGVWLNFPAAILWDARGTFLVAIRTWEQFSFV